MSNFPRLPTLKKLCISVVGLEQESIHGLLNAMVPALAPTLHELEVWFYFIPCVLNLSWLTKWLRHPDCVLQRIQIQGAKVEYNRESWKDFMDVLQGPNSLKSLDVRIGRRELEDIDDLLPRLTLTSLSLFTRFDQLYGEELETAKHKWIQQLHKNRHLVNVELQNLDDNCHSFHEAMPSTCERNKFLAYAVGVSPRYSHQCNLQLYLHWCCQLDRQYRPAVMYDLLQNDPEILQQSISSSQARQTKRRRLG